MSYGRLIMQMHDNTFVPAADVNDSSRIRMIADRIRQCSETANQVTTNLSGELDRIFGPFPTGNSKSLPTDPKLASGALGELDELVAILSDTLEHICSQIERLSSI